jgi:hypothetical protein
MVTFAVRISKHQTFLNQPYWLINWGIVPFKPIILAKELIFVKQMLSQFADKRYLTHLADTMKRATDSCYVLFIHSFSVTIEGAAIKLI